jgi:hypothetical protein
VKIVQIRLWPPAMPPSLDPLQPGRPATRYAASAGQHSACMHACGMARTGPDPARPGHHTHKDHILSKTITAAAAVARIPLGTPHRQVARMQAATGTRLSVTEHVRTMTDGG